MDLGLKGKVAVVTGADGGLGKAIATGFVSEGARVALVSRTLEKGEAAACELRGRTRGADVEAFAADLTYGPAVDGLAQAVREHFGGVQILVNAAGGVSEFATFDDLDDDAWTKGLELNLMTAVRTIRAFLPDMRLRQWGRIINVASEDGIQPYPAVPHYSAARRRLQLLHRHGDGAAPSDDPRHEVRQAAVDGPVRLPNAAEDRDQARVQEPQVDHGDRDYQSIPGRVLGGPWLQ